MSGPLIGGARLVTADDICRAAEKVLVEHLPGWAEAADLPDVTTWQQLPALEAISSATVPAGAITSPGLTGPPVKHRDSYQATWRLSVAVYDRGSDHTNTNGKVRRWAALIRTVLVQHQRLGGLALRSTWVGEDYALAPAQGNARTLGGCSVSFDVVVDDVVPAAAPPELGGAPVGPVVTSTPTTVAVRTPTAATVRRPAPRQE